MHTADVEEGVIKSAKKHFLEEPLKEAEQTNSIYTRKLIK